MGYTLYVNGPYKQNNGSAITANSTDINVGTAKAVRDSVVLNRAENSTQTPNSNDLGITSGVGVAHYTVINADIGLSSVNGQMIVTADGLGTDPLMAVGIQVVFDAPWLDSIYTVAEIIDGDTVRMDAGYHPGIDWSSAIAMYKVIGTITPNTRNNFIMQKNDATVHGQADPAPLAGASDFGRRKVTKFKESFRTYRSATAIRENRYNIYTGRFQTDYPSNVLDAFSADDAVVDSTTKYGLKGELTYRDGGANPTQKDFSAKNS